MISKLDQTSPDCRFSGTSQGQCFGVKRSPYQTDQVRNRHLTVSYRITNPEIKASALIAIVPRLLHVDVLVCGLSVAPARRLLTSL